MHGMLHTVDMLLQIQEVQFDLGCMNMTLDNSIKKLLLLIFLQFFTCLILFTNNVRASTENFIRYEAVENISPIEYIMTDNSSVFIIINVQSEFTQELILHLNNFTENNIGLPNPDLSPDQIRQQQVKLGIDYDSIVDQLNLNNHPNIYEVINQIEDNSSGIYVELSPEGQIIFKITNAAIIEDNEKIVIRLYNSDVLDFDKLDNNTLSRDGFSFKVSDDY